MTATELYDAGELQAAIDAQTQAVRARPADPGLRVFLFELLACAGDLDRAARQLQAVGPEDPAQETARQSYLALLTAERARREVFAGAAAPKLLEPAPDHLRLRLDALARADDAADARARADAAAPPVAGTLNGRPFDGLRDLDDRFGPVLEVMVRGQYYWVAVEQLVAATLGPPKYPRDLLWAPARLELADGQTADVFLPALYPDTHAAAADPVRLGRATEWLPAADGAVRGVGARVFLAGDEAVGLLDWRELTVAPR